jgi:membrane protein YdbS with pleckstrin-like domain
MSEESMKCAACGENLPDDALFCPKCGERQGDAAGAKPATATAAPSEPASQTGAERFRSEMAQRASDPALAEPEKVLWQGAYSPKAMLGGWVLSLVVTIVAFAIGVFFIEYYGLWIAAGVSLAIWLYHLLLLTYERMSHEYKLTTQRFMHAHGVVRRTLDRIEVIDIDDVRVTQGPLERLVNVGTIRILASDVTTPRTDLRGIADAARVATLIDDIRRAERRKRSLHISTLGERGG